MEAIRERIIELRQVIGKIPGAAGMPAHLEIYRTTEDGREQLVEVWNIKSGKRLKTRGKHGEAKTTKHVNS